MGREICEKMRLPAPSVVPKWRHQVRGRPERRVLAGLGPRPTKPSNPSQTPSTQNPRRTLIPDTVPTTCRMHPDPSEPSARVWHDACATFFGDQRISAICEMRVVHCQVCSAPWCMPLMQEVKWVTQGGYPGHSSLHSPASKSSEHQADQLDFQVSLSGAGGWDEEYA